jgi:hypothetical protein
LRLIYDDVEKTYNPNLDRHDYDQKGLMTK